VPDASLPYAATAGSVVYYANNSNTYPASFTDMVSKGVLHFTHTRRFG